MATREDSTPHGSPGAKEGATPSKQRGSALTIRTPGLEPVRRRVVEDPEATQRREELRALAEAKQVELEEILAELEEEKRKLTGKGRIDPGSSPDGDYDPVYGDTDDTDDEEQDSQRTSETRTSIPSDLNILRTHPTRSLRLKAQSSRKEKPTVEPSRMQQRGQQTVDSSSQREAQQTPRRFGKARMVEAPQPLEWQVPEQTTRMMARRALSRISASPFTEEISEAEPPKKFVTPRFTPYDGKADPLAHYRHYMQAMTLWSWDDRLMCRVFPSSLGDTALQWFHKLPPRSIGCWEQLAEEFVTRFLANAKQPKTADVLLTLKKKSSESLRDYSRRYMELYNEVEGCTEQLAVTSFKLGLRKEEKLWLSLTKKPASNMSDLMCRIEKYAKVEDETKPAEQKEAGRQDQKKGKPRIKQGFEGEKSVFEAVNTVFKEPIYRILPQIKNKPYFKRPGKLPDYPGKETHKDYCSYHQDRGHRTGECRSLRLHLEDLVKGGHLKEFIDEMKTRAGRPRPQSPCRDRRRGREDEPEDDGDGAQPPPPARQRRDVQRPPVIHVIHMEDRACGGEVSQGSQRSRSKEVLEMASNPSRKRKQSCARELSFSEEETSAVEHPHNDALVISLGMFESEVRRILVDAGSSTEVMFLSLFKKLGLGEEDLEAVGSPLIGFNAAPVWPLGRVTIPVRAGPAVANVEFIVVDVPSSYNAIVGRSWLHQLKAVPSTYHQVLKFPYKDEVVEIRGDQDASKKCFMAALKSKPSIEQVQLTELHPDTPKIDDVGRNPEQKAVEDLEKVQIEGPDSERFFLIGTGLTSEEKKKLSDLLVRNIDNFAWTPEEMPGIHSDVISHRLNVGLEFKPVIQKPRRSSLQHAEAVNEEVGKLLEAKVIREVSYPQWLANTVVVKKKDGRWRVCVDYTDLNKACPKDPFPLPKIDQLVDSTAGSGRMSFLDAYRGYHQIPMYEPDQEKTSFITPRGIYCYKVMPFGLKNAGATYQRLVTRMFREDLGRRVEIYIDDMVVKSVASEDHLEDLQHVFSVLDDYGLKLNAAKCAFGVSSGKFLGHLVTRRGIEADPVQIKAIQHLSSPTTKKEVQRLTGMVAALNRFISRASDKCRPFFKLLKGPNKMIWDDDADTALQRIKQYLLSPPILSKPQPGEKLQLYLAVSDHAVSAVLIREEERIQKPVYYASKTLQGAEARYTHLEKFIFALVMASRKLGHYFHAHTIQVVTDQPIRQVLHRADMSGRIAKWSVALAAFDIEFMPRTAIKAQVLADFVAEFTCAEQPATQEIWVLAIKLEKEVPPPAWQVGVDGSSSKKGAGVGIVLTTPEGETIEHAIKLGFEATNNEAEYEALLAGLQLARRLAAQSVIVKTDSQLVANQLKGEYEARNERMVRYLALAQQRMREFISSTVELVGRDSNVHADALATLAASPVSRVGNTVIMDVLEKPSISLGEEANCIRENPSWMDPIINYLKNGTLPDDKIEARKLRIKATRFWISPDHKLYKRSFTGPYLLCVHPSEVQKFLYEIHEGICGAHTGGRSLAHRAIAQGYWWPNMGKDAQTYVKKCKKCQKFSTIPRQPARHLSPLTSPWPFAQWGLDIVGPLPKASGNRRWLIVGTDYFTKWVEAEPLAQIKDSDTMKFVWKSIITRYGIPRILISDNGTQFDSSPFKDYCSSFGIKNIYSTPAYPQGNGQAEASNKVILNGIKKKLDAAKGKWVEELPSVLWTYRTTPRRSTGETPFSLTYGAEAVIPLEVGMPTIRTTAFDQGENDSAMGISLELLEERREAASIRLAAYQQEVKKKFNKNVRPREFLVGDFVLRKILGSRRDPTEGKLGASWEGPFRVTEVLGNGAYRLEDAEGRPVRRPWNAVHLRVFYV